MGLDMYLHARRFYWRDEEMPKVDDIPEGYKVDYVIVNAHYWRKANAIHDWFVQNVQEGVDNCHTYRVSHETLGELIAVCERILNKEASPEETLPTSEGFFFGSTEYGEDYYEDLTHTVEGLRKVLADFPESKWSFEYHSSW
jgi:hypothetical protein